jgi:hypothetical protein
MNLKDFLANKGKPPELYWSLVIEKGWVQAGIWYIDAGAANVLNISTQAAWETEDELIEACDTVLSSAVSKLPEDYEEPNKTVFGVAASWVKNGEITDEYLAQIKKVCTDLSLSPVGFVVLPEAIAHLYKAEESTPLSAVIVGLGAHSIEVSVFKMGNLAGTTSVARSVSLIEDVTEGLSRFEGAAPLPSRIIVYDGKEGELEDAKEELMKTNWDGGGKVKFLHTPKAEVLASDRKVFATSLAGANEIGNVSQVVSGVADKKVVPETNATLAEELNTQFPPKTEIENIKEPDEPISAEEMGFVTNPGVTSSAPKEYVRPTPPPQHFVPVNPSGPKSAAPNNPYLQKTRSLFHGFKSKLTVGDSSKLSLPSRTNPLIVSAIAVVLLVVLGGLYLWFVSKAVVTIYVSPKTFQEQVGLSFSTAGELDESKGIIPAEEISSSATGEKTKSTTGTKLIGDRAAGSVQIANGNGKPINVPTGTVLTSSAGLKFLTSTEASISGQLIPGSPGTATLAVTAADIGAQYNLAKGEVFKVGAFDKSQVAATSQTDFSGGSSRQIAAVSAEDQRKLEEDLKTELSSQIIGDLQAKIDSNQVFVSDLSELTVTTASFDHKVGDTVDTVKLALTVKGTGIAADKSKLLQYTVNSLKSKIPDGYALRNDEIGFKFTFKKAETETLSYDADINANFLPLVKSSDLTNKISGKSIAVVTDYLSSSVPGYSRAEIKISPHFPPPFSSLPHLPKNIKINVVPEE